MVEYSSLLTNGQRIFIIAAASLLQNDKVGPFHGGYRETSKSKMINPKYVQAIYQVNCCPAHSNIIGVGAVDPAQLPLESTCCRTFQCDETYYLRIDLKGSPALRYLNHNQYHVAAAYTGCCPDDDPTATVSSGVVMQGWIEDIIHTPTFFGLYDQWDQRMINIGLIEICDDGQGNPASVIYLPENPYWKDGNPTPAQDAFAASLNGVQATGGFDYQNTTYDELSNLVIDEDCCYGLIIEGAFVETVFGDCTFQTTDKYEIEPLIGQVSMVDETGDPCEFEGVCLHDGITPAANGGAVAPAIQTGNQLMGSGEEVLRSLILSQSYEQNFFANNDLRIREITQGYDISSAITRSDLYTSVYILHSIPRFNNPTGVFDNDQYLLRIPIHNSPAAECEGSSDPSTFLANLKFWLGVGSNNIAAFDKVKVFGCCGVNVSVEAQEPGG